MKAAKCIALAATILMFSSGVSAFPRRGYLPSAGLVPDETTAVRIAEAVLIPIYGEAQVYSERPFRATLDHGVWTVRGSVKRGDVGGAAVVRIRKADGEIIYVIHEA